ncbi:MAG: hypothetical protein PHS54_06325 [Clostridia bacterium]|nr:hypothetical protein [Clostridia bacterium]
MTLREKIESISDFISKNQIDAIISAVMEYMPEIKARKDLILGDSMQQTIYLQGQKDYKNRFLKNIGL